MVQQVYTLVNVFPRLCLATSELCAKMKKGLFFRIQHL
jgi:hypothetical protein